ncbi:flippase [Vibrio breoganii]
MINNYKYKGFIKYLLNTAWIFSEKILRIILGLSVSILLARYLGPKDFGVYNYSLSIVVLFTALANLGLDKIIVKELVSENLKPNEIIGTSIILRLISSFFIILTVLFISSYVVKQPNVSLLIVIFSFSILFQSFSVIDFYFQSKVRVKYSSISKSIAFIVCSLLNISFIYFEFSVIQFSYLLVLESILFSAFLIYFFSKKSESIRIKELKFELSTAKSLLKQSWPMILSGLAVTLYMKVDQIMLSNIISEESVGIYSAALRLSESWYFIPAIISSSLFPAILNAKKIDEKLYIDRVQDLFYILTCMSFTLGLVISTQSEFIIDLLYGEDYIESSSVLTIHIWTGIFVFIGVARGGWIVNENLQVYSLIYTSLSLVANISLNFYLIPRYGVVGAAYATLISQVLTVLIFPALFVRTRILFFMTLKSILIIPIIHRFLFLYRSGIKPKL